MAATASARNEEALAVAHLVARSVQLDRNLEPIRLLPNPLAASTAGNPIHDAIAQPRRGRRSRRSGHEEAVAPSKRLESVPWGHGPRPEARIVLQVRGRDQRMMAERALLHRVGRVPSFETWRLTAPQSQIHEPRRSRGHRRSARRTAAIVALSHSKCSRPCSSPPPGAKLLVCRERRPAIR